eukprot:2229571-Rhodomonas_salina.4
MHSQLTRSALVGITTRSCSLYSASDSPYPLCEYPPYVDVDHGRMRGPDLERAEEGKVKEERLGAVLLTSARDMAWR